MISDRILEDLWDERERQEKLWSGEHSWGRGSCASPDLPNEVKSTVLNEECGEVARAVLERSPNLRAELIQVAAVAVAWVTAFDE